MQGMFYIKLVGNRVGMLTHSYHPNLFRQIKVAISSHQANCPVYLGQDVWFGDVCKHGKECGRTWHQMLLLKPGVN